jgi:N-acetylmuramoyl-L-alanine amidase
LNPRGADGNGDRAATPAEVRARLRGEERRTRKERVRLRRLEAAVAVIALAAGVAVLLVALESAGGRTHRATMTTPQKPGPATTPSARPTSTKRHTFPSPRVKHAGAPAAGVAVTHRRVVPKPHIVWRPIPFGPKRRAETAAYALRHYGIDRWQLVHPQVIVEHYTASLTFASTYNYFAGDTPDVELGELPGVCAHFVIDKDGTIYQLVPLNTMCRHTVGLNWTAIGIEHVGITDQQILNDPAQIHASLALTLWLMSKYHIQLRNVIGHNESLTSPYHRELYKAWRCRTHADWNHADMQVYRADLATLARRYGLPLGPPARPVKSSC